MLDSAELGAIKSLLDEKLKWFGQCPKDMLVPDTIERLEKDIATFEYFCKDCENKTRLLEIDLKSIDNIIRSKESGIFKLKYYLKRWNTETEYKKCKKSLNGIYLNIKELKILKQKMSNTLKSQNEL